jgi:hypothetical protein
MKSETMTITETTSVYPKTDNRPTTTLWPQSNTLLAALVLCGALLANMAIIASAAAADKKTFATADEAAASLIDSLGQEGVDALLAIMGSEHELELFGGDPAAGRKARLRVAEAAQKMHKFRDEAADKKVLLIGANAWPLPFPLSKAEGGWQFDTEAGIEEMVTRRIGANELATVEICRAYVNAQAEYAAADRDSDEVLEYAQVTRSAAGQKDGLFRKASDGDQLSPFGPLIADAKDYLEGLEIGDPSKGYYYKVLTRQGAAAPGGRHDYVINGNMIAGFGMIAFPAMYDNSGVMTIVCNHHDKVYQKNFGEDSDLIAAGVDLYDPDSSWTEVEE